MVSDSLSINSQGHLAVSGADTVSLAAKYGTPLMVYSEDGVRRNCRKFVSSIQDNYDGNGLALYASKAFSCLEMYRICDSEQMGVDVVSGGEIHTALKAGFPAEKILFHGNNKTPAELGLALDAGVGRYVVDNFPEMELLDRLAGEKGVRARVLLRITPGIDAHTHDFIKTGLIDSKFGFTLETGEALDAVRRVLKKANLDFVGVHCHIGSQIFDIDPFEHAALVMLGFIRKIKDELGFEPAELNLGGGFGVKYLDDDDPEDFTEYMRRVAAVVKEKCAEEGLRVPFILIEPGRSIVGAECVTLYTVGGVKRIPGVRTYVSIDGGMADNPRYILYQAAYQITCANKANEPRDTYVTLAGKCCESGDLIQENAPLQRVEPGDIVAVMTTGAYNYSMASNYNRIPRPAVLMVSGGKERLIIRRETNDDLLRLDI
ncbi:MAG: diaminopimelate decarboxylase [Clostridia bacterium]|nr:diaminopimelate decarboxylase [Clostridia bacterium]MBR5427018.1 diaminopimelate decarboxylase [Clostridia bacterium]